MELDIKIDDSHFFSDSIDNGRLAKKFFITLTNKIFEKSHNYYSRVSELANESELNLTFQERNLYSMIGAAIDSITPIHVSEWCFVKENNPKNVAKGAAEDGNELRIVDFCCTHKESTTGKALNYFIEIKKDFYCLNERSKDGLTEKVKYNIEDVLEQLRTIKCLPFNNINWFGYDNIYMGLSIIHGYYMDGCDFYNEKNIHDSIHQLIDQRSRAQLITSTWYLPESMEVEWENQKCKFITINGIIISKVK